MCFQEKIIAILGAGHQLLFSIKESVAYDFLLKFNKPIMLRCENIINLIM